MVLLLLCISVTMKMYSNLIAHEFGSLICFYFVNLSVMLHHILIMTILVAMTTTDQVNYDLLASDSFQCVKCRCVMSSTILVA